jgi:hypothetical protein
MVHASGLNGSQTATASCKHTHTQMPGIHHFCDTGLANQTPQHGKTHSMHIADPCGLMLVLCSLKTTPRRSKMASCLSSNQVAQNWMFVNPPSGCNEPLGCCGPGAAAAAGATQARQHDPASHRKGQGSD